MPAKPGCAHPHGNHWNPIFADSINHRVRKERLPRLQSCGDCNPIRPLIEVVQGIMRSQVGWATSCAEVPSRITWGGSPRCGRILYLFASRRLKSLGVRLSGMPLPNLHSLNLSEQSRAAGTDASRDRFIAKELASGWSCRIPCQTQVFLHIFPNIVTH